MLKLRRHVLGAALGITMALAAGCGSDHHTTVLSPAVVQPADVASYADGSPAQAAIQLLQAIQYNEPATAASFFVPAWRITARKLVPQFRGLLGQLAATLGRGPRIIAQVRTGRRASLVVAVPAFNRVVLDFDQIGTRWKLAAVRSDSFRYAPRVATHPQAAPR
jgi:hypothetical protein